MDNFKKKVQSLSVDAFRGMGTNLTAGLTKVHEVFRNDGMTQEERFDMGINTNSVRNKVKYLEVLEKFRKF